MNTKSKFLGTRNLEENDVTDPKKEGEGNTEKKRDVDQCIK